LEKLNQVAKFSVRALTKYQTNVQSAQFQLKHFMFESEDHGDVTPTSHLPVEHGLGHSCSRCDRSLCRHCHLRNRRHSRRMTWTPQTKI